MKKALIISSIIEFISSFEINDIKILQKFGYEIHCACNNQNEIRNEKVIALLNTGIICHNVQFARSPFSKSNIDAYKQLKKVIKEVKPEIIHCHTPIGGALGRIAGHKLKVKSVIYTAHGFHFYKGAPIKNWLMYFPVELFLSKMTDIIITINHEDYNRANRCFFSKRVFYIPGVGVNTAYFANCIVNKESKRKELGVKTDDFLLLSVGELSERKNQKVIIEALKILKQKGNIGNIISLMVGTGKLEKAYSDLISQYGLENHIKLLGHRSDIDELCKTVDCFVHPSVREGLGIAPLEAMAAGLPLISAYTNGIRDYTMEGISGCCIEPTSVEQMVKAILKMRDDSAFRETCGKNNSQTAKQFDISNTSAIMEDIYKSVIS